LKLQPLCFTRTSWKTFTAESNFTPQVKTMLTGETLKSKNKGRECKQLQDCLRINSDNKHQLR